MTKHNDLTFPRLHKSATFIVATLIVCISMIGTAKAAGELDMSFGYSGVVVTDFAHHLDIIYDMVVQPDGKIVVAGLVHVDFTNWYDFGLIRYNPDGSLDPTFGTGGKVTTNIYLYDEAHALALQPDGKIVVVGSTVAVSGSSQSDFAIARYNSDGSLDTSFGNGGKVTVDFDTIDDVANAVVIQSDNKIVVGGTVRVVHGSVHDTDFGLVRLNSNGSLDTTFDGDGRVNTHYPSGIGWTNDTCTSLAIDSSGRIVAGGSTASSIGGFVLIRYNTDGSLDTTFDTDGMVLSNAGNEVKAIAIQSDGKILAMGPASPVFEMGFGMMRCNPDGSLDSTFSGDGTSFTRLPTGSVTPTDMAMTAEGKIVAIGWTTDGKYIVARFVNNGDLDTTFGTTGIISTYISQSSSPAHSVAIQGDGKILVAGQTHENYENSDFVVFRFLANPISVPVHSDFDGDGRSDFAVFRPSDGNWYVLYSSNGAFRAEHFGADGDIAAPGDYDGDRKTDFAVFRPSNGNWYILHSSDGSFRAVHFGSTGDIPVAADYSGDAKTDIAVYRPSQGIWYTLRSSDNGFDVLHFGTATDRPVPGYYDNDEKADIAFFRESPGDWYMVLSATNTVSAVNWGKIGDVPVPANFDGDGKNDFAVYRASSGKWFILRTLNGQWTETSLGAPGDMPVPGDYTGDSITDVAMFRPGNGSWYLVSQSPVRWGTSGDVPVENAYLH